MSLSRLIIKNFKSIKSCDISLSSLNLLIGENGTGKTNILEAINYFYSNLTSDQISNSVFDENNRFSNELRICLAFDFSEFVKIAKTHVADHIFDTTEQKGEGTQYSNYFKAILHLASRMPQNELFLELTQIKGCAIKWNLPYSDRAMVKSLFPIFHVDTRSLDVVEWDYLWNILGELAKVSNEERKSIEDSINHFLLNNRKEISEKLLGISDIFKNADVAVQHSCSREFAENLIKVYFSGDLIYQKGKHLDYYSTGTNSVKYLELLLRTVDSIAKTKIKEPIILLDEPEISLHTNYLDELTDALLDVNSRLSIIVSTHSPRLTKNIITDSSTALLYNVKLLNGYTIVKRMNRFSQYSPSSKYRVTDDHINSYFSRGILFVEGESELELFSNPYLKILFPELKKIDVFAAMSQIPVLKIMNPSLVDTNIPYICLIDMDKAIDFSQKSKHFSLKKEYFPSNSSENFRFRNKHDTEQYLLHQRKRINSMQEKLHVHYYAPFLSCKDPAFESFISAIQQYLLSYNVFAFKTTVEGALITEKSKDFAENFLKERTRNPDDYTKFSEFLSSLNRPNSLNALRIAFNGKSDLLKTWSSILKIYVPGESPSLTNENRLTLDNVIIGKKTSGWISDYIDDFFKMVTSSGDKEFTKKIFQKYISDPENKKSVIEKFELYFPELYSLISKLCDMI